ncbi:hypothetical protein ACIRP7_10510 [Streptomyces sp. NPDC102270]|uniref:hypothetical protein n=1 Tax=Streptomyces sp. NPDC102270 TaxID=3366150 RepID=UPI00380CD5A3
MTALPASVDRDILDHRIIVAITAIRETRGCTIHEAIDVFAARYEELRRDRPDDFSVRPEEYGRGFVGGDASGVAGSANSVGRGPGDSWEPGFPHG